MHAVGWYSVCLIWWYHSTAKCSKPLNLSVIIYACCDMCRLRHGSCTSCGTAAATVMLRCSTHWRHLRDFGCGGTQSAAMACVFLHALHVTAVVAVLLKVTRL
jgi:hypothetical protein